MHEVGISYRGNEKLRRRASKEGKPPLLASRRQLNVARKDLENGMEYEVSDGVVQLASIKDSVLKRLRSFNPNVSKKALLSVDKGQGKFFGVLKLISVLKGAFCVH
jgi:hypothetical protein